MKMRATGVPVILAAAIVWVGCQAQVQETKTGQEAKPVQEANTSQAEGEVGQEVVASVGGVTISAEELEDSAKGQLQKIRAQIYQVKKRALDGMIEDMLIEKAAKEKGVSVEEYVAEHVDAKVSPPTDEQIEAFYNSQKGRMRAPLEQMKERISGHLMQTQKNEKRREMIALLKKNADVKVMLEPPRTEVSLEGLAYTSGEEDAKIVLVEFSDYECPYSKRAQDTVHKVLEEYKGKIHYAFFDFPLGFHKHAMKAHEAARCAGEQGKYAEYSVKLFENQRNLGVEGLKQYAKDLDLDSNAFDACLEEGKTAASVKQSVAKGSSAGVSGTPAFFVNGILISGAQPYEKFQEVLDAELAR
jgi:protein-disulfide isomerase